MPVTKSSPDGGKTTYYENPDLAAKLRSKGVKAEVGKRSSNMTQAQRQAKSREYAARPQPQRGNSRGQRGNGAASPTTQPVARPNGAQGPLMQNGNYGMGSNSAPLAQTFAQSGANSVPQRPTVFTQPQQYGPSLQPDYRPMMPQMGFDSRRPASSYVSPPMQQRDYSWLQQMPYGLPYSTPQRPNPWSKAW